MTRGAPSKPEEIELKYDVSDPRRVRAWLDSELPPGEAGWRRSKVVDRYFDAADGALADAGYGARLRSRDGEVTIGLKSEAGSRGRLHRRLEIEGPATPALVAAEWPPSEARSIVEELTAGRWLVERFVLRQRRDEREVGFEAGRVRLSLDQTRVFVGGLERQLSGQLEVELVDGDARLLRRLDRRLSAIEQLTPQPHSKMALAEAIAAAAERVAAADSWTDAGRKVLRRHLLRMLEREPSARAGDPTGLKQMRVATRRARATWRLFGAGLRRGTRRRQVALLRDTGRALGAVRDLDVLIAGLPAERALAGLRRDWREERGRALGALRELLDSAPYRSFVVEYIEMAGGGGGARKGGSVAERGAPALRDAYATLVSDAPTDWDAATDEEWHAVRRRARRLRYTLESLRDVLPTPQHARLIARLVRVQDHLGALNDAVVAAAAMEAWLAETGASAPAAQRRAVEEQRTRHVQEAERLRHAFAPVWRGVAGAAFAGMLNRALTALER